MLKIHNIRTCIVAIFVMLISNSCKKRIIEILPVLSYENISIPNINEDIKYFSFPSINTGYAAADFIYKTNDGGKTWIKLDESDIHGLVFIDEMKGWCISNGNQLKKTKDGGKNWEFVMIANFLEKNDEGLIVAVKTSYTLDKFYICKNNETFEFNTETSYTYHPISLNVYGNKAALLGENTSVDGIKGVYLYDFDTITNFSNFTLNYKSNFSIFLEDVQMSERLNQVYLKTNQEVAIGNYGYIGNGIEITNLTFHRKYYDNTYDYYSIDSNGEYSIVVGEKSIVTNMNIGNKETWNEVFKTNGDGFEDTFYKIDFFSKNQFFVSGNKGLIWRVTI